MLYNIRTFHLNLKAPQREEAINKRERDWPLLSDFLYLIIRGANTIYLLQGTTEILPFSFRPHKKKFNLNTA